MSIGNGIRGVTYRPTSDQTRYFSTQVDTSKYSQARYFTYNVDNFALSDQIILINAECFITVST